MTVRLACLYLFLLSLGVMRPLVAEPVEIDIEKIKQKYWARGKAEKMEAVQNRVHTKEKKVELGVAFGGIGASPFLVTRLLSFSSGYHLSETFSAHLTFEKAFVAPSSARTEYERITGKATGASEPLLYTTVEMRASFLYGKVNISGNSVWYFDGYLSGGTGVVFQSNGSNPLVSAGVGQQIHLTELLSLNASYKFYWYSGVGLAGAPLLGMSLLF